MKNFSKYFAIFLSLLVILITSLLLLLKLIQITPNEKEIVIYSPSIKNNIEIKYDNIGFPRIESDNLNDLYFGIGYAQAESRMWQMDLLRRMAQGKLSEILGAQYISYDKFIRFFNLTNISKVTFNNFPTDLQSILYSYSSGVNTFINENSENLAIEFSILNYSPQQWKPEDCVLIFNFIDFLYNSSFKDNLLDLILKEKLSIQEYNELTGLVTNNVVQDTNFKKNSFNYNRFTYTELNKLLDSIAQFHFLFNSSHSNSFAIRKQKGGIFQSIIATDFTSELSIPSFGMTMIATSPDINILGTYIPGIPFCTVGKNDSLSWVLNITNSNRWNFENILLNKNKSLYKDSDSIWRKVDYEIDTIYVKNSYPRFYYLKFVNNFGLFTDAFVDLNIDMIAHPPADLLQNSAFVNLYKLNFTKNIVDIQILKRNWTLPKSNIIFGDKSGNIGIISLGNSFHFGKTLNDKPLTEFQMIVNPRNNYVISTNIPIDTNYNDYLINNFRSRRLKEFLSNLVDFELRDIKNIQLDAKSEFSKEFLNIIIPIIRDKIYLLDKNEKAVFDLLTNWDYSYTRNQKQPIIIEETIKTILFRTFYDNIDSNYIVSLYNRFDFYEKFIKILNNNYSIFFDDLNTPEIENRDYIIFTSAKNTFKKLSKNLSLQNKINHFKWGSYNKSGFSHFVQNNKLVNATFLIDSIEINGHRTCISSAWKNNTSNKSFGTTSRMIFENYYSNVYSINCLGNSGDPTNDHFSDQLQVWKNGGYIKINLSPKIEKVINKRIIKPKN